MYNILHKWDDAITREHVTSSWAKKFLTKLNNLMLNIKYPHMHQIGEFKNGYKVSAHLKWYYNILIEIVSYIVARGNKRRKYIHKRWVYPSMYEIYNFMKEGHIFIDTFKRSQFKVSLPLLYHRHTSRYTHMIYVRTYVKYIRS